MSKRDLTTSLVLPVDTQTVLQSSSISAKSIIALCDEIKPTYHLTPLESYKRKTSRLLGFL